MITSCVGTGQKSNQLSYASFNPPTDQAGFFFNSMYERQLAYNICTKMFKEHPYPGAYRDEKVQRKICKWHVYVLGKNRPDFLLNFKK